MKWERKIAKAKRKHRPKLKNWGKDGFHRERRGDFNEMRVVDVAHKISIVSVNSLTVAEFIERFELLEKPCIIRNVPVLEDWSAVQNWTLDKLVQRYGNRYFKVGEDDDGYAVKVKFKHFVQYLYNNTDDSPLYIFDSHFDTDKISKSLLTDFRVPSFFPDDLFSLVGERKRPPYRWFLVGPAKSGTCVHIDPLGTSAWNTVISGCKRWVLFPPGTAKAIAKATEVIGKDEDDEAINYFVDFIPRLKSKYGAEQLGIVEFLQLPGDTVYVPGGWWHAVLNVEDSIAVTQNYCSRTNFDKVWRSTRKGRKRMAVKWLQRLQEEYPGLARRADALNAEDDFIMYSSSDGSKKKKKRKKDKHKHKKKLSSSSSST